MATMVLPDQTEGTVSTAKMAWTVLQAVMGSMEKMVLMVPLPAADMVPTQQMAQTVLQTLCL